MPSNSSVDLSFIYVQVDQVINEVNSWVVKYTNNVIKTVVPRDLGSETRLILANALYFKGNW